MKTIMLVFGTRPEAIKMCPLVKEFQKHPHEFETIVCVTGQHREMLDQVQAANRGISSKNLPDAENRGYGIYTSKRMLVEGLGGQYLMISGGNFYLKTTGFDSFYSLPAGLRWNGTIIALRIPYNVEMFNYVNYLE